MENRLSLAGEWKLWPSYLDIGIERFGEVLHRGEGKPYLASWPPHFLAGSGYLKAQVPGDVTTALVENEIIKEPLIGDHSKEAGWIQERSWWYIREFEVSEKMLEADEVRLTALQLDYQADIMINDRYIGKHSNAFLPFAEDVKRALHAGTNRIIIRLTSGTELYPDTDSFTIYSDSSIQRRQRLHLRKPQFTYGWDWCKMIPTCGIGRDIYLEAFSGARINHLRCDTIEISEDTAQIALTFEVEKTKAHVSADGILEYEIWYGDQMIYQACQEKILAGGLNWFQDEITIKNPKLWWPNGYGKAELYTVKARCICQQQCNEMPEKRIGIRTVEINTSRRENDGRNFYFEINGVRVFGKGGNWVPADSLYMRVDREKYRILIEEAAAANYNMLRIWGGGQYETDDFYEFCNENGIMIFHDFMFACGFYQDRDPAYLYNVIREAEYQVKRLAHVPCVVLWDGNNENHEAFTDWFTQDPDRMYGERIFNDILPQIVRSNSSVFYMPSSPYFGEKANVLNEGDVHAWTFFGRDENTKFKFNYELEAFDRFTPRFCSEYGFHGALMESSMKKLLDGTEFSFENPLWKHHGEEDGKHNGLVASIDRHLTDTKDMTEQEYLLYCGLLQGCMYLEMAEGIRRREQGSGFLIWMYNDAWPETGWTIIDYFLTRKVSFYLMKRAFAHKKMIVRKEDGKVIVTVINDTPEAAELQLEYGFMHFDGAVCGKDVRTLDVKAHSWQQFTFACVDEDSNGFYYVRSRNCADFETASSLRAYYRGFPFKKPEVQIESAERKDGNLLVTLTADVFVPFVYLDCGDDTVHYSDNYFALYPGEKKIICIENADVAEEQIQVKIAEVG